MSDLTWTTEKRRLADLVPWAKNPRILTAKAAKDIAASLDKFGLAEPLVLNTDGMIVGGHQRKRVLETILSVSPEFEVDVRIPSRLLTKDEFAELNIRLNRNVADWDWDALANEFDQNQLLDFGFEPIDFGIAPSTPESVDVPQESPAPIEVTATETRVKKGDVWAVGTNGSRFICGDSTDPNVLLDVMGGEGIDFVITSPPYNINMGYSVHNDNKPFNDYLAELRKVVEVALLRLGEGRCLCWNIGTSPMVSPHRQFVMLEECGLDYMRVFVWRKIGIVSPNFHHTRNDPRARRLTPHYQHEVIGMFRKGELAYGNKVEFDETLAADVFDIPDHSVTDIPDGPPKPSRKQGGLSRHSLKVHPAAFPAKLPAAFIQHLADIGGVVYDPYLGAGTTLLASEALGRVGVGAEVDPMYCEVILRRAERLGLIVAKVRGALEEPPTEPPDAEGEPVLS